MALASSRSRPPNGETGLGDGSIVIRSFWDDFLFTGSGEEPLTFEWDFENDLAVDSTLRNPSHTYLTTGGKTVRLTVTNIFGTDTATTTIQIPLP